MQHLQKILTNTWKTFSFGALISSFAEGCWTYLFYFYSFVSFTALEHYHFSSSSSWNSPMSSLSPLYQQLSRDHIKNSDSASSNPSLLPQWKHLLRPWLASYCFLDAFTTTIKQILFSTLKVTVINDAHKTKKNSCPDRGMFPTLSHCCSCLSVPENQQTAEGELLQQVINRLLQQDTGPVLS